MDFFEIEGKKQLSRFGIPIDDQLVLYSDDLDLESIIFPCVVKAQVLSGKRGKNGGICFAKNKEELLEAVNTVKKADIRGKKADAVLITSMADIAKEHYVGITLDTLAKRLLLLYSPCGGMDIESLAEEQPEQIYRFDITEGFCRHEFLTAIENVEISNKEGLADIAEKLVNAAFSLDATTIEINPLAQAKDGSYKAIDSKLSIDNNSLPRQDNYQLITRPEKKVSTEAQKEAEKYGIAYVELKMGGDIGIIAGGAGIGMATVDTIVAYGGLPYNFLDLGGGVTSEKTKQAALILMKNPDVKAILINVFGGINNCQDMAEGIKAAQLESGNTKPVVVKSRGFNQEEGWKIYTELGYKQVHYGTTDDAVKLLLKEREAK